MKNTELATNAYGKWDAEEVAYITDLHWASGDESSLILITLVQPRTQRTGSWPRRDGPWYRVVIKFGNVRNFSLKQFGATPRQVMGFTIDNLKERGLEGINYQVDDYEDGLIAFCAETAGLVSVERFVTD